MSAGSALDWIEAKKHGRAHARDTLRAIVAAVTDGSVPDYQVAAWLMALWHAGLDPDETLWLTEAMRDSGAVLTHADGLGPTADKHSTGGVGDKASLVVAPLAAELGLVVPMLSGRGLGHTGGTLDKLEAIPGYRIDLAPEEFERVLSRVGCSIIGQSPEIAPADRRLYALRDVTGTVDCVGLIVASILSKKLAAGPRHLVIDLKCGSGAFMRDLESARELAAALTATGRAAGLRITALVTDMAQPVGEAIGHAGEVLEAVRCLSGEGPPDLRELCIELVAEMGSLAGLGSRADLRVLCAARLDDGSARERLGRMVEAHGGAADFERRLEFAPEQAPVIAGRAGCVRSIATDEVGRALIDLGGARRTQDDRIDHGVGLLWLARIGARVERGEPLCRLYARDAESAAHARRRVTEAVEVGEPAVEPRRVVLERD